MTDTFRVVKMRRTTYSPARPSLILKNPETTFTFASANKENMKPTFAYPARRPYTFNLLATAVIALILGGCATTSNLPYRQRGGYPLVSGHRGANCIAPENTIASLDRTNFTFGRDENMTAFRRQFDYTAKGL